MNVFMLYMLLLRKWVDIRYRENDGMSISCDCAGYDDNALYHISRSNNNNNTIFIISNRNNRKIRLVVLTSYYFHCTCNPRRNIKIYIYNIGEVHARSDVITIIILLTVVQFMLSCAQRWKKEQKKKKK